MQKHTWIIHRKRTILIWILESRLRWLLMKVSAVLTINTIPTGIKSTWCRPFTGMSWSWHCRLDSIMFWYANYFAIWKINGSSGSNFRREKKNPVLFLQPLFWTSSLSACAVLAVYCGYVGQEKVKVCFVCNRNNSDISVIWLAIEAKVENRPF